MPNCEAKINNKICGATINRGEKLCAAHKNWKAPVNSKKTTGMGIGDTKDKTGKAQAHNMQPKGGLRK